MKAPTSRGSFLSLLDDISPFFALGSRNPLGAPFWRLSRNLGRQHRMKDRLFRFRRLLGQG
jgi:hypothetical protein